jgi:integrase
VASFDKRTTGWRARVVLADGRRVSRTFDTKAQAKAWAEDLEAGIVAAPGVKNQTLGAAMRRFTQEVSPRHRGHRWQSLRLEKLARDPIADVPVADLQRATLADWRERQLASGLAPASVAREMTLLRQVLRAARVDWGWLTHDPMHELRQPGGHVVRDRRVSDDELWRMRVALGWPEDVPPTSMSQQVALMALLAVETAMRSGELCTLTWGQLHLGERWLRLDKTKNGDSRDVPLSTRAVELMQLLRPDHFRGATKMVDPAAPVFTVSSATRDALWRKARDSAQIEGLRFHDLRHEAVTRLARKLDVLDLSRMTGHRDLKMLRRYYNPAAAEIARRLG